MIGFGRGAVVAMVGASLLAAPTPAVAGRATASLPVSVSLLNGCTVSAMPMQFVVIPPFGNTNVDTTSAVTIRCTPNTAYTVDIDTGLHANGINRRLFNPTANAYLTYDVYRDPPRSQVWGTGGAKNLAGNSGLTGIRLLTVYGRLLSTSKMQAGGYRDTLTITLNF